MRIIKLGLISIVVLFLIVTGMSLLLPSSIIISRAIDLNAPEDSVYDNVADLSKWQRWYPVSDTATFLVSTVSQGEGASVRINKTTIFIKEITEGKIKMMWIEGDEKKFLPAEFNIIGGGDSHVTLQWQFVQTVKWYPWEKFASIVTNKTIGTFMEQSLDNFKAAVEGTR